jgi:nitrogen fixation protein FixH
MPIDLPATPRPAPRTPRPITGRHVFFALLAFFGVITAINAVMIVLALRTMPGLEVRSAYEASQRFNRELDAIDAQDQRGWQVDIAAAALRDGRIGVEIRDRTGKALANLEVLARFERPTDARMDRAVALVAVAAGRYEAASPGLVPGQWLLTVEIRQEGQRRFLSKRRIHLAGSP